MNSLLLYRQLGFRRHRTGLPVGFGAVTVRSGLVVNARFNGDVELPVSWEIAQHLENTRE